MYFFLDPIINGINKLTAVYKNFIVFTTVNTNIPKARSQSY